MIAVDTNVLVYAHRRDSAFHAAARDAVAQLAESSSWAIAWPCIYEFLAVVTNPRIFRPATPIAAALDQVAAWMESPGLVLLSESDATWDILRDVVVKGRATGGTIHDARIATLCLEKAIDELWTADRDFGRFRGVKVRNPLV